MESQNRQVRKDFKEMKIREARTMSDYSELEEENVVLQKQLAGLKQTQVRHTVATDRLLTKIMLSELFCSHRYLMMC